LLHCGIPNERTRKHCVKPFTKNTMGDFSFPRAHAGICDAANRSRATRFPSSFNNEMHRDRRPTDTQTFIKASYLGSPLGEI